MRWLRPQIWIPKSGYSSTKAITSSSFPRHFSTAALFASHRLHQLGRSLMHLFGLVIFPLAAEYNSPETHADLRVGSEPGTVAPGLNAFRYICSASRYLPHSRNFINVSVSVFRAREMLRQLLQHLCSLDLPFSRSSSADSLLALERGNECRTSSTSPARR